MNESTIFIFGLLVCNIFVLGAYDHLRTIIHEKEEDFNKHRINEEEHLFNKGVANFK